MNSVLAKITAIQRQPSSSRHLVAMTAKRAGNSIAGNDAWHGPRVSWQQQQRLRCFASWSPLPPPPTFDQEHTPPTRSSTSPGVSATFPNNSRSDWFSWWMAKIPKGFENFGVSPGEDNENSPSGNNSDNKDTKESSSSSDANKNVRSKASKQTNKSKQANNASGFSFLKDEDKKNKKQGNFGGNNNNSSSNQDNQNMTATLALLVLLLTLRSLIDSEKVEGQEITFVEFRNRLLLTGQVERLEIVNESLARVILKPGSPGLTAANAASWHDEGTTTAAAHAGSSAATIEFDAATHDMMNTTTVTNVGGGRAKLSHKDPSYYFYIGSVESFEQKLTAAQQHWHPSRWVEVQYMTQTDWAIELIKAAPLLLAVGTMYYMMRGMPGAMGGGGAGGGGPMSKFFNVGKSTAKKFNKEDVAVRFADVAGCQQAKMEIMEFVDFLKHPERFTKLGARIPKGALLCGPPGTGKTLLAKAVAGEAGVPFYSIAGSDFLEMFVGVGPSRVRDLFKEARKSAPSIIFIDEIDAVGRQRGRDGFSGGIDERDNTLNQLLVEMDGFSPTTGVVVLAGTNRVDILDQALTRPGRFDRQITVDRPDLAGRKEIFAVHLKGITLDGPIDDFKGRLAGLTPGFTGADIANICNEAAIVAARRHADAVSIEDFEKATDRVIGGLESNKLMSQEEKSIVAHHEAGHAIAGWFLENCDPVLKVTIVPRSGGALGFAQYLPKEIYLRTQQQILDMISMALAGRAAEDVFFGRVTTGASDDLKRVTDIAYAMIQIYGMNSRVGQLSFSRDGGGLGDKPYSDATAEAMDEEARALVEGAYERTVTLIKEKQAEVEALAKMLMEKETITHDDIVDLIGPRPFVGDAQYEEYISMRNAVKGGTGIPAEVEAKEDDKTEVDNEGGFTPTPLL